VPLAIEATLRDLADWTWLVNNAGINDNAGLEHGTPEKFLRSHGGQSSSLLQHGSLRAARFKKIRRLASSNIASKVAMTGTRRHLWLCCGKRCNPRPYARVGYRIAPLRYSRERVASRGSDDAASTNNGSVAFQIPTKN